MTDQIVTLTTQSNSLTLNLPEGIPFDEWVAFGINLATMERRVNWWIGDWWNAGDRNYGEARAKAATLEIFGIGYDAVRKYGRVAERFESGNRFPNVSFTHHIEAAPLPPGDRVKLLEVADKKKLSVREFKGLVLNHRIDAGQISVRVDDDPDYTDLSKISAAWNRASRNARQSFLDLAQESELGIIDP